MSNATHADQSDHETHPEGVHGRLRTAAREHPLEFTVRAVAGVIGLLLLALTVEHVTRPGLAAEAVELLGSAAGQWLAVAVLAVVLVVAAVSGALS